MQTLSGRDPSRHTVRRKSESEAHGVTPVGYPPGRRESSVGLCPALRDASRDGPCWRSRVLRLCPPLALGDRDRPGGYGGEQTRPRQPRLRGGSAPCPGALEGAAPPRMRSEGATDGARGGLLRGATPSFLDTRVITRPRPVFVDGNEALS
jgi:hypothetical protein